MPTAARGQILTLLWGANKDKLGVLLLAGGAVSAQPSKRDTGEALCEAEGKERASRPALASSPH